MAFKLFFSFSLFTKKNSLPSVIRGGKFLVFLKEKLKKTKKSASQTILTFFQKKKWIKMSFLCSFISETLSGYFFLTLFFKKIQKTTLLR
jgi:hypothetical protein